jgi:hypothetical protein
MVTFNHIRPALCFTLVMYKTCTKLQMEFEYILNLLLENGLSEKKFSTFKYTR